MYANGMQLSNPVITAALIKIAAAYLSGATALTISTQTIMTLSITPTIGEMFATLCMNDDQPNDIQHKL